MPIIAALHGGNLRPHHLPLTFVQVMASEFVRCPLLACAVERRRFPGGARPTRQPLQPEAIGAVMEVTKWLKPSISVSRMGDSASVQAATRVNAEQALYEEGKVKRVVSGGIC